LQRLVPPYYRETTHYNEVRAEHSASRVCALHEAGCKKISSGITDLLKEGQSSYGKRGVGHPAGGAFGGIRPFCYSRAKSKDWGKAKK